MKKTSQDFDNLEKAIQLANIVTDKLDGYGLDKTWDVKLDKTKTNIELYNRYKIKDYEGMPDGIAEFKVKIPLEDPTDYKLIALSNRYKFQTRKIEEFLDGLIEIQTLSL